MRKIIAVINMTIDGICDHTSNSADEELHGHYTDLLSKADAILYGRTTYQLMQYWQNLYEHPGDDKSANEFASIINRLEKIVFSHTLKETGWDSAILSDLPLEQKVLQLKQQPGNDILIGSRSLIIQLLNANLIDEFQLCIHPIIYGKGLKLFDRIDVKQFFKLPKTKQLKSGAIVMYYQCVPQ